jgi:hypothetical protein
MLLGVGTLKSHELVSSAQKTMLREPKGGRPGFMK